MNNFKSDSFDLRFDNVKTEASRCLFCYDAPCIDGCPTSINIPGFINQIYTGDILGAADTILQSNILGYSCAKVCPVEILCVKNCVLNYNNFPIQIGKLQEFAMLHAIKTKEISFFFNNLNIVNKKKKIAIIGSGPSSVSAAGLLINFGNSVEIFEKDSYLGGLNSFGIIPSKITYFESLFEIDWILRVGVKINYNTDIFDTLDSNKFIDNYDCIILATGLGEDKKNNLIGYKECSDIIFNSIEIIKKIKLGLLNQNFFNEINTVHIIGGGNTAIDVSFLLKSLGIINVEIYYRKDFKKMPAYKHEISRALKIGVKIFDNFIPIEIEKKGKDYFISYKFSLDNVNIKKKINLIIFSIGQTRDFSKITGFFNNITLNEVGLINVDLNNKTNNDKIWAVGDCINGGIDVVSAVETSKIAVKDMLKKK